MPIICSLTISTPLPAVFSVGLVGLLGWLHHRGRLGADRTDPVRAYEYAMSAIGLSTAIGSATTLTALALGGSDFVPADTETVIAVTVTLGAAFNQVQSVIG